MIEPECEYGFTSKQVEQIMDDRLTEFLSWAQGCTTTMCATPCAKGVTHGNVTMIYDVQNFLHGVPNQD